MGMTQAQVGAIIGRSQVTVSNIEKGAFRADPETIDAYYIASGGLVTANDLHNQVPVPKAPVRLLRKLQNV